MRSVNSAQMQGTIGVLVLGAVVTMFIAWSLLLSTDESEYNVKTFYPSTYQRQWTDYRASVKQEEPAADTQTMITFWKGMTSVLLRKVPVTQRGTSLSYCEQEINAANDQASLTKNYQTSVTRRLAYLKSFIENKNEACITAVDITPAEALYTMEPKPAPKLFGPVTCPRLRELNNHYQQFCINDTIKPSVLTITQPQFYNPILTAIPNAVVNNNGVLIRENGDLFGNIGACKMDLSDQLGDPNIFGDLNHDTASMTRYEKIFSICQIWGNNPYHFLSENLPRLAYHLKELVADPSIKIHVQDRNSITLQYLEVMGISEDRVISGNFVADIVFLPETSPQCGHVGFRQAQMQRDNLRNAVETSYPALKNGDRRKKQGIVIRRRGTRELTNHDELMALTMKTFPEVNFQVFDADHLPSQQDTYCLFYSADIVIAPHGAGLGNAMICREHLVLVEFLTTDVNFCFADMAHQLNFRYFGMMIKDLNQYSQQPVDLDEVAIMYASVRDALFAE